MQKNKIKKDKIQDYWLPVTPPPKIMRTLVNQNMYPQIEMKMVEDGIDAEVVFPFFFQSTPHVGFIDANYKRIIKGSSKDVYTRAARAASKIGLSDERNFNTEWNRTLLNLLNKPSENKTMINLGVYKPKEQSGLYNIKTPAELLSQKLIESKLPAATLAARAGVDEATLFRHLSDTFHISREVAFKYAKVLGCDPSELLFNPLEVPVWGSVDLHEMKSFGTGLAAKSYSTVYPGEIIGFTKEEHALCPREIYRPDAKSIRIDQKNSFYHNQIAFYYNSNEHIPYENQLVVAGVRLKNSDDDQIRWRYFFGIYKKNKNNKTVDILNPDPEILSDVQEPEYDDDANSYIAYLKDIIKENRYVIKDIEPEFVSPIVALVDHGKIQNKENYIKDHNKYYSEARKMDLFNKSPFKELLLKKYILEKEKEKIKEDIENGTLKYSLSDQQMNQEAEKKWSEMNRLIKDLYYSDILKKINKKIRPDITIKTDEGIKNFEIKTKNGIKTIRENLSQEEIDRINAIDDHLNETFEGEQAIAESKRA